jgi:hypothetical protein
MSVLQTPAESFSPLAGTCRRSLPHTFTTGRLWFFHGSIHHRHSSTADRTMAPPSTWWRSPSTTREPTVFMLGRASAILIGASLDLFSIIQMAAIIARSYS